MNKLLATTALGLAAALSAGCGGDSDDACDADFPDAPSGAKSTLFVAASCPTAGADGTRAHPLTTLGAAIAKAPKGGTILVAAGTYKENLVIDHDLSILGASSAGSYGDGTHIILQAPKADAVTVPAGATVRLEGFHIEEASGVGVFAKGGDVTVVASKIEKTKAANGTAYGFAAVDGAHIILQDSEILGAQQIGVYVSEGSGSVIESKVTDSGTGGIRLESTTEDFHVEHSILTDNALYGVAAFSSGAVILSTHITGTTGLADGSYGDAIVADFLENDTTPSTIDAEHNVIAESDRVGILMGAGGIKIILQDNAISGAGRGSGFGAGIWLQGGAGGDTHSIIEKNHLTKNRFVGIGLTGETHGMSLKHNEVTGTIIGTYFMGAQGGDIGDGLNLFSGASAQIHDNHFTDNDRAGIILDGEAGSTDLEDNIITGNGGVGIILQNQKEMPNIGASNTIHDNKGGEQKTVPNGETGFPAVDKTFGTVKAAP